MRKRLARLLYRLAQRWGEDPVSGDIFDRMESRGAAAVNVETANKLLQSFLQKLALAVPAAEKEPTTFTPAQARFFFDFFQTLLLEIIISRRHDFNPEHLRTSNPELYWRIVEFGVLVEKLNKPIDSDRFKGFLRECWDAWGEAVIENQIGR